jgi:hypothetical protein
MDEPSSLQQFFDTTSYISATPFLSRRNPVFGVFCRRGSFFGPRGESAAGEVGRCTKCLLPGYPGGKAFNTEGTENTEKGREIPTT